MRHNYIGTKKIIATLLVMIMMFSCIPPLPADAVEYSEGDFTYTVTSSSATIVSYPEKNIGTVTIPSSIGGYTVRKIGAYAFSACTMISEIIVPATVTSIGSYAFSYCISLKCVHIPASVDSIGSSVLQGSSSAHICSQTSDCYAKKYADNNSYSFSVCTNHVIKQQNIVYGSDTFSFCNSDNGTDGGFSGIDYAISDEYQDILFTDCTQTEISDLQYFINEPWGGSCFGMSCVLSLTKAGQLDTEFYQADASTLHDFEFPIRSETVESLINYYQVGQIIDPVASARGDFDASDESENLKNLVNTLKESTYPVVFGIDILLAADNSRWGGHAVVAYGVETVNDYYRLSVWDPNDCHQCIYLFIKNDYSDAYFTDNTQVRDSYYFDNSNFYTFVKYALPVESSNSTYNHNDLQVALLASGTVSGNTDMLTKKYARKTVAVAETAKLKTNYQNFTITRTDGAYATVTNGTVSAGNLKVEALGAQNNIGYELSLAFTVENLRSNEKYTITPSKTEISAVTGSEIKSYSTNYTEDSSDGFRASCSTDARGTVIISSDGGIKTNCSKAVPQNLAVAYNDVSTKWYDLSIKGTSKAYSLNRNNDSVIVSSDSASVIDINVKNTYNNVSFNNVSVSSGGITVTDSDRYDCCIVDNSGTQISTAQLGNSIVFYSLGGNGVDAICNIPYNTTASAPKTPVRKGYTFDGWYKSTEYKDTEKWNFSKDKVTEDIKLYAKWVEAATEVTISILDSDFSLKYKSTRTVSVSKIPEDYTIVFSSSDSSIAEVDSNGIVKAVGEGEATITATLLDADGNNVILSNGKKAEDSVKVKCTISFWQKIIRWLKALFNIFG